MPVENAQLVPSSSPSAAPADAPVPSAALMQLEPQPEKSEKKEKSEDFETEIKPIIDAAIDAMSVDDRMGFWVIINNLGRNPWHPEEKVRKSVNTAIQGINRLMQKVGLEGRVVASLVIIKRNNHGTLKVNKPELYLQIFSYLQEKRISKINIPIKNPQPIAMRDVLQGMKTYLQAKQNEAKGDQVKKEKLYSLRESCRLFVIRMKKNKNDEKSYTTTVLKKSVGALEHSLIELNVMPFFGIKTTAEKSDTLKRPGDSGFITITSCILSDDGMSKGGLNDLLEVLGKVDEYIRSEFVAEIRAKKRAAGAAKSSKKRKQINEDSESEAEDSNVEESDNEVKSASSPNKRQREVKETMEQVIKTVKVKISERADLSKIRKAASHLVFYIKRNRIDQSNSYHSTGAEISVKNLQGLLDRISVTCFSITSTNRSRKADGPKPGTLTIDSSINPDNALNDLLSMLEIVSHDHSKSAKISSELPLQMEIEQRITDLFKNDTNAVRGGVALKYAAALRIGDTYQVENRFSTKIKLDKFLARFKLTGLLNYELIPVRGGAAKAGNLIFKKPGDWKVAFNCLEKRPGGIEFKPDDLPQHPSEFAAKLIAQAKKRLQEIANQSDKNLLKFLQRNAAFFAVKAEEGNGFKCNARAEYIKEIKEFLVSLGLNEETFSIDISRSSGGMKVLFVQSEECGSFDDWRMLLEEVIATVRTLVSDVRKKISVSRSAAAPSAQPVGLESKQAKQEKASDKTSEEKSKKRKLVKASEVKALDEDKDSASPKQQKKSELQDPSNERKKECVTSDSIKQFIENMKANLLKMDKEKRTSINRSAGFIASYMSKRRINQDSYHSSAIDNTQERLENLLERLEITCFKITTLRDRKEQKKSTENKPGRIIVQYASEYDGEKNSALDDLMTILDSVSHVPNYAHSMLSGAALINEIEQRLKKLDKKIEKGEALKYLVALRTGDGFHVANKIKYQKGLNKFLIASNLVDLLNFEARAIARTDSEGRLVFLNPEAWQGALNELCGGEDGVHFKPAALAKSPSRTGASLISQAKNTLQAMGNPSNRKSLLRLQKIAAQFAVAADHGNGFKSEDANDDIQNIKNFLKSLGVRESAFIIEKRRNGADVIHFKTGDNKADFNDWRLLLEEVLATTRELIPSIQRIKTLQIVHSSAVSSLQEIEPETSIEESDDEPTPITYSQEFIEKIKPLINRKTKEELRSMRLTVRRFLQGVDEERGDIYYYKECVDLFLSSLGLQGYIKFKPRITIGQKGKLIFTNKALYKEILTYIEDHTSIIHEASAENVMSLTQILEHIRNVLLTKDQIVCDKIRRSASFVYTLLSKGNNFAVPSRKMSLKVFEGWLSDIGLPHKQFTIRMVEDQDGVNNAPGRVTITRFKDLKKLVIMSRSYHCGRLSLPSESPSLDELKQKITNTCKNLSKEEMKKLKTFANYIAKGCVNGVPYIVTQRSRTISFLKEFITLLDIAELCYILVMPNPFPEKSSHEGFVYIDTPDVLITAINTVLGRDQLSLPLSEFISSSDALEKLAVTKSISLAKKQSPVSSPALEDENEDVKEDVEEVKAVKEVKAERKTILTESKSSTGLAKSVVSTAAPAATPTSSLKRIPKKKPPLRTVIMKDPLQAVVVRTNLRSQEKYQQEKANEFVAKLLQQKSALPAKNDASYKSFSNESKLNSDEFYPMLEKAYRDTLVKREKLLQQRADEAGALMGKFIAEIADAKQAEAKKKVIFESCQKEFGSTFDSHFLPSFELLFQEQREYLRLYKGALDKKTDMGVNAQAKAIINLLASNASYTDREWLELHDYPWASLAVSQLDFAEKCEKLLSFKYMNDVKQQGSIESTLVLKPVAKLVKERIKIQAKNLIGCDYTDQPYYGVYGTVLVPVGSRIKYDGKYHARAIPAGYPDAYAVRLHRGFVDAREKGNITRFLNRATHQRKANCVFEYSDDGKEVFVVAIKEIKPGEQWILDYGDNFKSLNMVDLGPEDGPLEENSTPESKNDNRALMQSPSPEKKASDQQLGWNCFDIAVGLSTELKITEVDFVKRATITRAKLVDYALQHKSDAAFRKLLAPEIKSALLHLNVYRDMKKKAGESTSSLTPQEINRLKELYEISAALPSVERKSVDQQVQKLVRKLDMHFKSLNIPSGEKQQALLSAKDDQVLQGLYHAYEKAHEDMIPAARQASEILGYKDGHRKSLAQLDQLFANDDFLRDMKEPHKGREARNMFMNMRNTLYTPHEVAFENYCCLESTYVQYVENYYGKNEWMAYQRGLNGEKDNTSMVDIVARLLNARIAIYQGEEGSKELIYQTEYAGNRTIYIEFTGGNHFNSLTKDSILNDKKLKNAVADDVEVDSDEGSEYVPSDMEDEALDDEEIAMVEGSSDEEFEEVTVPEGKREEKKNLSSSASPVIVPRNYSAMVAAAGGSPLHAARAPSPHPTPKPLEVKRTST